MIKKFLNKVDPVFYDYLTVFFFGVIVFMGALGESGLRNDDINYAAIAKSVLNHDNFMILHRNNEIYLSKPPLYFWLTAISLNVFGITVFGAKFVSALCAVMIMLLIFKIAKDTYGNVNAGYGAVLFFASNYMIYKVSHGVRLESLLTLTVLAGVFFAGKFIEKGHQNSLYFAAFFCGLAVMTKGYLGVMTFAVIVASVLYFRKNINQKNIGIKLFLAFIVFICTFIWWYYYAVTHTDFFQKFFVKEALSRFELEETPWDSAPIYKYAETLIKFSFFVIPFVYIAIKRHSEVFKKNFTLIILTALTLIYFIIIHFLTTKFSRYLYPVVVLMSIIGGVGLASVIKVNLKTYVLGISVFAACVFAIYPGSYGDEGFRELTRLEKMSKANGVMLCTTPDFMKKWENRSGIYFFTESYRTGECAEDDIIIQKRKTDCPDMTILKNSRITACMKQ